MPFSGLRRPANRTRVFPLSRTGRGWAAKPGSANGYTTLIVATSTSKYLDHSAAAYRLVAIRVSSLVPSMANARCRSLMGGGLCRMRKAGRLVGTVCASLTKITVPSSSLTWASVGSDRKGISAKSSLPSPMPRPTVTTCAGMPRRVSSLTWPTV